MLLHKIRLESCSSERLFLFQLKMTCKYKCVTYNKLLLFSMDIENVFGSDWVIEKLYFHFNKNSIEGKYVKPYVIKFTINKIEKNEDDRNAIIQTEECKWSLEDIYNKLNFIPLYLIKCYPKSTYGIIDINDKMYTIFNTDLISQLLPYEDISYEFEVKNGSIIINELIITELERILNENNIEFEVVTNKHKDNPNIDEEEQNVIKKYISVYGVYDDCEPSYKINISLDGKTYDNTGFCIYPEPIDFKPYMSIGKFRLFSGKSVGIPNDEHLALITKCKLCDANIICDWLNLNGTCCPYCGNINQL